MLLDHLYKDGIDKPVGMFNLGPALRPPRRTGTTPTDPEYFGTNTNFISDKELEAISLDMKRTDRRI